MSRIQFGSFEEVPRSPNSGPEAGNKRSPACNYDFDTLYNGQAKRARRSDAVPAERMPQVIDLTGDENQKPSVAPSAPGQPCVCGTPCDNSDDVVRCSSGQCRIGSYHRICVGLGNKEKYRDTSTWRCLDCRRQASSQAGSGSQGPPSTSFPVAGSEAEPPLHPEQRAVVGCIESGRNTFYTGSGGVGKSTVLKAFVRGLRAQGKQVDIIAPSGIAAIAVGGVTIFSYAGWHPDIFKEGMDTLLAKAMGKNVRKRLCRTDVLVIDEISMVERDMLSRLDTVMRSVRNSYKPERGERKPQSRHSAKYAFGGVQIVVTGDFLQLPPVKPYHINCGGSEMEGWAGNDGSPKRCRKCLQVHEDKDKWAFKSPAWEASDFAYFELRHIHRQNDQNFISILQKCRHGLGLTQAERQLLLQKKNIVGPVKLLPQKREVNRMNQEGLKRLTSHPRHYECLDFYQWRNRDEMDLRDKGKPLYPDREDGPIAALRDHRFEERIELKVGMRVILLVNIDLHLKLVNGAQGTIVKFETYDPNITYVERPSEAGRGGKETDEMSELASLKEENIHRFIARAPVQEWPVVKFDSGAIRVIPAHCQVNELGSVKPYSRLGRTQIPLLAAWAITIHKSQGMTLDKASVDLGNSFEREMVYVALSRVRSLEGLEVTRLPPNVGEGMDPEVRAFLQKNVWRSEKPSIAVPG